MNLDFILLLVSNAVLSALSISNLGIISSMVGFLHEQKDNVGHYQVNFQGRPTMQLSVEPKKLWVDQGHLSNGVAGYGFFLGLFGCFVAWWITRRKVKTPSKNLTALVVLHFLAVLFTLVGIIYVFLYHNRTKGQKINPDIAKSNVPYPVKWWTPETWFKAVLDVPLVSQADRSSIESNVTNMVAWRWMLIPIWLADIAAFAISTMVLLKQRKNRGKGRVVSEEEQEK